VGGGWSGDVRLRAGLWLRQSLAAPTVGTPCSCCRGQCSPAPGAGGELGSTGLGAQTFGTETPLAAGAVAATGYRCSFTALVGVAVGGESVRAPCGGQRAF